MHLSRTHDTGLTLLFWAFCALLCVIPLIFFPGLPLGFERAKTLALYIGTICMFAGFSLTKNRSSSQTKLFPFVLFYYACIVGVSVVGANWSQSFWGSPYRLQGIFTLSFYVMFYFLASRALTLGIKKTTIALVITVTVLIASLYIFAEAFAIFFLHLSIPLYPNGRITGTFSNPNLAAGFLVITFPFVYLTLHDGKTYIQKILYYFFLLTVAFAIFLTGSRGGMLSFFAALALLYLKNKARTVNICLAALLFFLILCTQPSVWSVFARSTRFENRSEIWTNAIEAIIKKPITGYGWENFNLAMEDVITRSDKSIYLLYIDRAHNEILELLTATGIVGLTVYVALLQFIGRLAWKKSRVSPSLADRQWYKTLLISLVIFLIFTQFNFLLTTGYVYFWFIVAAIDS